MDVAKTFKKFLDNLAIKNVSDISQKYKRITNTLNKQYYDSESEIDHSLQVGSYGRGTAINGISDLDMLFILPYEVYQQYNSHQGNGQSALLQAIKSALLSTYPNTNIGGDGQVVAINFQNYTVEVLPCFLNKDGSYTYPNSNDGGSWKITDPKPEIEAINNLNNDSNGNLKKLCKMVRAWKNNVGLKMGGMLIDTLCYNFINSNSFYKDKSYSSYNLMVRDFFNFLKDQNKDQEYWHAPGSNKKVYKNDNFIAKAKKAYNKSLEAIENENYQKAYGLWRDIFNGSFPTAQTMNEAVKTQTATFRDTEEFIEDKFPVDIRNHLEIDCIVKQHGFRNKLLRSILAGASVRFPLMKQKKLEFFIDKTDVQDPYMVRWKVRNVGAIAERKDQIRGQILIDGGHGKRTENSNFHGPHYVECYIIKNDVCVARDKIDVPIKGC